MDIKLENQQLGERYGLRGRVVKVCREFINPFSSPKLFMSNKYKLVDYQINKARRCRSHTGVYLNKFGKKVVIRNLDNRYRGIEFFQLLTEVRVMNWFNKHKMRINGYWVKMPKFISLTDNGKQRALIREYVVGKPLAGLPNDEKIRILSICLKYFERCSKKLNRKERSLFPYRDANLTFIAFPIYLVKVIMKELSLTPLLIRLAILFYHQFLVRLGRGNKYNISHRDFHQENILVNKNRIYIIDPEICATAQRETDVSIIAKFYFDDIGVDSLVMFLSKYLGNKIEKANFITLTIFYSLYLLANEGDQYASYKQAKSYLIALEKEILPQLKVDGDLVRDQSQDLSMWSSRIQNLLKLRIYGN